MFRQPGLIGPLQTVSFQSHWKQDNAGTAPSVPAFVSIIRDYQMGLFDTLKDFFQAGAGRTLEQLADWLQVNLDTLVNLEPTYNEFTIPKRSGGQRVISAPDAELKKIQRTILHRLLKRLKSHPNVTGFESRHSIVTNANAHVGSVVVLRMDIKDFFASTSAKRVGKFFSAIGWNRRVSNLLTKLCTHNNALPQGAPTSPRLSNLLNYPLDARLAGLASQHNAVYTRYADDITFSFDVDDRKVIRLVIRMTKVMLEEFGYQIHHKKKLFIRRRHQQQKVTGLVVNERVALPRETRRWLRAVQHHHQTGRPATLTDQQLAGWQSLHNMIAVQANQ